MKEIEIKISIYRPKKLVSNFAKKTAKTIQSKDYIFYAEIDRNESKSEWHKIYTDNNSISFILSDGMHHLKNYIKLIFKDEQRTKNS